jgi:hypothetical protein
VPGEFYSPQDDRRDDLEWAADHGQRRFRVRPYRLSDEVDHYVGQLATHITITDLKSFRRWGSGVCSLELISLHVNDSHTPGHFEDSDAWARREWQGGPPHGAA